MGERVGEVKDRKETLSLSLPPYLPPSLLSPSLSLFLCSPAARRGKDGTSIKRRPGASKRISRWNDERAYAVIATEPMNDAVYDSPIPIDRPTN